MLKSRRILIPVVTCLSVAACSENPLAARGAAPRGPVFDGGHMLGSGAFVDSASTKTSTAATLDAAADTTSRGGHMLGSGA